MLTLVSSADEGVQIPWRWRGGGSAAWGRC